MRLNRNSLLLYGITDRRLLGGKKLSKQVEEAILGGATIIQLREKNLNYSQLLDEALSIKYVCMRYNIPFIINDDVRLAKEIDADGVHVGQRDMEASNVREILGSNKILGVSAQTVKQAILAQESGADYIGCGAVFNTGSKDDALYVSLKTLKEICSSVSIPVVAIGGINLDNVMELSSSGVCGVAVINSIFGQENIRKATIELKNKTLKMVGI